jgi:hypothetical protein
VEKFTACRSLSVMQAADSRHVLWCEPLRSAVNVAVYLSQRGIESCCVVWKSGCRHVGVHTDVTVSEEFP